MATTCVTVGVAVLVRPLWTVSERGCCGIVTVYDTDECCESGLSQLARCAESACHFCVETIRSASEQVWLDFRRPRAVACGQSHAY